MTISVRNTVCAALTSAVAALCSPVGGAAWRVAPEEIQKTPGWMIETGMLPVDADETECAEVPDDMTLFLLVGQSNMAGRGLVSKECRSVLKNAYKLTRDDKWVRAGTPVHFDRKTCGVGIAESFVQAFHKDNPGRPVGLIPCAVGGSNSATWSPEPPHGIVGVNFYRAVARARKAMKHGRLAGILWHQGEGDAARCETNTEYYPRRLKAIAEAFRRELAMPDVPFIVGEIGGLPANHAKVMNPLLSAAAAGIEKCALVPAADLTGCLSDRVHFDTPSYYVLGARYYARWKAVAQGGSAAVAVAADILAGRDLSDFICRGASPEAVAETFSLTGGVLAANAAHALVLESQERFDCENFVLQAEIRYESDGFADSGLQFCIEDAGGKCRMIEYQLKTTDIGDGWGLGGIRAARSVGEPYRKPNKAGDVRMPRQTAPVCKRGMWHRVSLLKNGNAISFFFDGVPVNAFVVDGAAAGRIGFQTKPCPEGRGSVSFRNVRMFQL